MATASGPQPGPVSTQRPEPGLDRTADPAVLVAADLAAVQGLAGHLDALGGALERTANGLRGIEVGEWSGDAADAFRARFDESPKAWFTGADAFADAAGACRRYAVAVGRAREQAGRAASLYAQGLEASRAAVRERDAAAAEIDDAVARGAVPAPLPEFVDPGVEIVDRAVRMLEQARAGRDAAGADAARVILSATTAAPEPPAGWSRVGAEVSDSFADVGRAMAGVGEGVEDIVRTARALNPMDPWNATHPAAFLAGQSRIGAGLLQGILHPADLVAGTVGTGWGSDPAHAVGKLLPGAALSVGTAGGGKIAAAVAERSAARAIRMARPPVKTGEPEHLGEQHMLGLMYAREELGQSLAFPGEKVVYLNEAARERHRLTVHDGRLYDGTGRPFTSTPEGSAHSADARSIFVMDRHGNLYAANEHKRAEFHHSTFLAGDSVSGAGEIKVVDGRLELVSNQSGHYKPSEQMTANVFEQLSRDGVDVSDVVFEKHGD